MKAMWISLATSLITACMIVASPAQTTTPQPFPPPGVEWVVEEITDGSVPPEIVTDNRPLARNGLPDGRVATSKGDIAKAWYSEPTTRYRHGVLGDSVEAGALKVVNDRGETYTYRLPSSEVFEDITPRLADLDNDGRTEVITILSSVTQGASVAVFKLNGNAFIKVGQSRFIGQENRWLNIAETGRITGSGRPEIAVVTTPHLTGVLRFYSYRNGDLQLLASAEGYSNHVNGSRELRLSKLADVDGDGRDDLAIPSLQRNELVIVGVLGSQFAVRSRVRLPARINRAIGTREVSGRTEFVLGLDNGKIYSVGLK